MVPIPEPSTFGSIPGIMPLPRLISLRVDAVAGGRCGAFTLSDTLAPSPSTLVGGCVDHLGPF